MAARILALITGASLLALALPAAAQKVKRELCRRCLLRAGFRMLSQI